MNETHTHISKTEFVTSFFDVRMSDFDLPILRGPALHSRLDAENIVKLFLDFLTLNTFFWNKFSQNLIYFSFIFLYCCCLLPHRSNIFLVPCLLLVNFFLPISLIPYECRLFISDFFLLTLLHLLLFFICEFSLLVYRKVSFCKKET